MAELRIESLPLWKGRDQILRSIGAHRNLLLTAPTGSGKSSALPWMLFQHSLEQGLGGQIAILQPRRIAARSVARFLARVVGEAVGGTVGYRFRFESCVSRQSRIVFWTYGSFLAALSHGEIPDLQWIVFDEFHERRMEMDLLLAWLSAWQKRAPQAPRIAVLSAELDRARMERYLEVPCLPIEVPAYPVTVAHQEPRPGESLPQQVLRAVVSLELSGIWHTTLVFLPGKGEISACQHMLEDRYRNQNVRVLSLFAGKEDRTLDEVFEDTEAPRIILCTNVAETSITIPGTTGVVDSGLERSTTWNNGITELRLQRISLQNAVQRTGRAGRTQPGTCVRLWSERDGTILSQGITPEIVRSRLEHPLLAFLGLLQTTDVQWESVPWLTPPPETALQEALQKLARLGLTDVTHRITGAGLRALAVPVQDTALAAALCRKDTTTPRLLAMACLLENSSESRLHSKESLDLAHEADALLAGERVPQDVQQQWKRLQDWAKSRMMEETSPLSVHQALLSVFPQALASVSETAKAYRLADGTAVQLEQAKVGSRYALVFGLVRSGSGNLQRISRCTYLAIPEFLVESAEERTVRMEASWNSRREGFVPIRIISLQDREASREEVPPGGLSPQEQHAFAESLRTAWLARIAQEDISGNWRNDANRTLIRKIQLLAEAFPEHGFRPWKDDDWELIHAEFTDGIALLRDLTPAHFCNCVEEYLGRHWLAQVSRWFPDHLQLPSGRTAKYHYPDEGPPEISARVADFFGMRGEHRIAEGRVAVLFDILAPNHRTAQKTWNISEFWERTYPQVRKELRGRYPRHPWPEQAP